MKRSIILAVVVMGFMMAPNEIFAAYIAVEEDKTFTSDGVIQEGDIYRTVSVYDTSPDHTTINMTGGILGEHFNADSGLYAYDSSTINISGGEVLYLHTTDSSTVNISGGWVGNQDLTGFVSVGMYGSSTMNLYEGGLITGGTYNYFEMNDSSKLNIYGGGVSVFFPLYGESTLNMYDGVISFGIAISGTANIYGGYIETWNEPLLVTPNGQLNIYGYNFVYDPQYKWSDDPIGGANRWISRLTGTGPDGVAIEILDIPDPYTTPNINLIPEPATIMFLALGAMALKRRSTTRRNQHI